MPNDAKLGLVVGVGLVIAVAALFFRKEPLTGQPAGEEKAASVGHKALAAGTAQRADNARPVPAKKTSRTELRRHTVQEGDTLYTLALHYYGDGDRFVDLYRANRHVIQTPDRLPAGTVLTIPDFEEATKEEQ
jgi:nucleoid-associated protein YgaU